MSCPPYIIRNQPFKEYSIPPFNTTQQIRMINPCNSTHPGKDYRFDGAMFGAPVIAMEPGTVVSLSTGNKACICSHQSSIPIVENDINFINCLQQNCSPNSIAIQSSVDGVVTEYVHVEPTVNLAQAFRSWQNGQGPAPQVGAMDQIGTLSLSGTFTVTDNGSPVPHVHINRFVSRIGNDICNFEFTCDFGIRGVDILTCPNADGWSLFNNEWVFCQNGARQPGWHGAYHADNNGVWSGFIWLGDNTYQYRPKEFRTRTDSTSMTVAIGWVCALGQWWFFDNNGNMVMNAWEQDSQGNSWFFGPNGACVSCPSCNN
ncbi:hypothetical protein CN316_09990 [Bacillus cereus]|nr:hypothetical protein CN316_09990 [Bacillus cereus]